MDPYKNFQISRDDRGIVTVSLDVPGRPMNVLTTEVLSELDRIVHELETSNGVRLVIFRSDKESGFLSGADVEALQRISTASETQRAVEMGQTLFQRIEWLPMPTVAVIHGPCLGGGLELALACDHRIARDNSSTKIGLPEIKLGLIPGWGGTQRLPQRVGLSNALSMILTGKHLSAHQAYRIGLIDQSIKPDAWDLGIDRFIDSVLSHRVSDPHRRRPIWQRWLESIAWGQRLTLHLATREVQSRSLTIQRSPRPFMRFARVSFAATMPRVWMVTSRNAKSFPVCWRPRRAVTCLSCSSRSRRHANFPPGLRTPRERFMNHRFGGSP